MIISMEQTGDFTIQLVASVVFSMIYLLKTNSNTTKKIMVEFLRFNFREILNNSHYKNNAFI